MTESLTCTVKRYGAAVDAADVGVPLITPAPSGFNDKPGGRDPLDNRPFIRRRPPSCRQRRRVTGWRPHLRVGQGARRDRQRSGSEACTVSVVLPVTPDSVADISVLPADAPVASPLASGVVIVATAGLDDAQVTWFVIFCVLPSE